MECQVDILIEDPRWGDLALEKLAPGACAAAIRTVGLDPQDCEVSILACNDERISQLNTEFRDKPQPTNVLSWPTVDLAPEVPGQTPGLPGKSDENGRVELGDIAIAYETCVREAAEMNREIDFHVAHLVIHATLHLLGYDHIREQDAVKMESLERESLACLGFPDPYAI